MALAKMRDHVEMVKQNMAAADRMEERVLRKIRNSAAVLTAFRTARSKADFDLVAVQSDKVRLIECKKNGYIERKRRNFLEEFLRCKPANVQVEVWWYESKRRLRKTILTRIERLGEFVRVRFQE